MRIHLDPHGIHIKGSIKSLLNSSFALNESFISHKSVFNEGITNS